MNHFNNFNNPNFNRPPQFAGQPPPFYPPNVPPPNLNRPPPPISGGYSTGGYSTPNPYQQSPYGLQASPMQSYYPAPSPSPFYPQQQQQHQQPYGYPSATSQMVNYPTANYMQYYQPPSYQLPQQPTVSSAASLPYHQPVVQNEIKPVPPPDTTALLHLNPDILCKPPPPPSESQNNCEKPPLPPLSASANEQLATNFINSNANTQPVLSVPDVQNSSFLNVFTSSANEPQKHTAKLFDNRSHPPPPTEAAAPPPPPPPVNQPIGNQFAVSGQVDHMHATRNSEDIGKLIDNKLEVLLEHNHHQQQQQQQQHLHPVDVHSNHNNSSDSLSNLLNKRQKLNDVHPDKQIQNQLQQVNELKQTSNLQSHQNVMNKSSTLFTAADDHWLSLLNPEQKLQIDNIKQQQKEFEDIYMNWEADYEEWKSSNVSVLDFRTYQTNLQEWEEWKSKLLSRKLQQNQKFQNTIDDLRRQVLGDQADEPVNDEPVNEEVNEEAEFNDQSNASPISSLESFNENFSDSNAGLDGQQEQQPPQPKKGPASQQPVGSNAFNNAPTTTNLPQAESQFLRRSDLQNACQQPLFAACQTMIEQEHTAPKNQHEQLFDQVVRTRISGENENEAVRRKLEAEREEQLKKERERIRKEQEELWKAEEKKLKVDDACDLITYVTETRDLLDTIDKLDFKLQQDKANYKHQLEYIKKTIESQGHSDSEEEPDKVDRQPIVDPLPVVHEQTNQFDLNSILNKMQQIKSSAVDQKSTANPIVKPIVNPITNRNPLSRSVKPNFSSQLDQFNESPPYSRSSGFADGTFKINNLFSKDGPYAKDGGLHPNEFGGQYHTDAPYRRDRPFDRRIEEDPAFRHSKGHFGRRENLPDLSAAKSSADPNFLSEFGIELNASKVLSYKNIEYFLKPPSFTLAAEDLFELPARDYRPNLICLILRGHPGSGKTNFINLILNEEAKYKIDLPKVFNFDEYLNDQIMKPTEELFNDLNNMSKPPAGQDPVSFARLENCKKCLFDNFSRCVKNREFTFVILNSINQKVQDYDHFYITAKLNGYSTYIAEMDFVDFLDIPVDQRDLSYDQWSEMSRDWELTPSSYIRLKVNHFVMSKCFRGEEIYPSSSVSPVLPALSQPVEEPDSFSLSKETFFSKLNLDDNFVLDKLDDFRMKIRRPPEEFWSLPDDYYQRKYGRSKRVRFLDVETKMW